VICTVRDLKHRYIFLMRVVNGLLSNLSILVMTSMSLAYRMYFPTPLAWFPVVIHTHVVKKSCHLDPDGFGVLHEMEGFEQKDEPE